MRIRFRLGDTLAILATATACGLFVLAVLIP